MKIEIKKWFNGKVLFAHDVDGNTLRITLEAAVSAKAVLSGADLSGAVLSGADLSGAVLRDADLSDADLSGADLSGADLSGADLSGADLSGADLRGADLRGAVLRGAVLSGADLRGAVLRDAAAFATDEEAIANLDRVREIILDEPARLDMSIWHNSSDWRTRSCAEEAVCGTTHCLAGWLQVCSTDPDVRALEAQTAGVRCAPIAAKMFFRGKLETEAWLRERKYVAEIAERQARRAAREAEKAQPA